MTVPASARIAALLSILGLAFAAARPASASSVSSLLSTAEHDTNTVRTLQHRDVFNETNGKLTIHTVITGQEDEVRNREHDFETVTEIGKLSNGKTKTLHYTLDIIFMNGHTYFRTTLAKNKWQTHKGMKISDPYSGIDFSRARTTVTFNPPVDFKEVGGSPTHLQGEVTKSGVKSTYQLWLTGGSKPYVTRQLIVQKSTKKAGVTATHQITYGPFNKPIVILAPTGGASA